MQTWSEALVQSFHISIHPKTLLIFCVLVWGSLGPSAEGPIGLLLRRLNLVVSRHPEGQASCEGIRFARHFARQISVVSGKAWFFAERWRSLRMCYGLEQEAFAQQSIAGWRSCGLQLEKQL